MHCLCRVAVFVAVASFSGFGAHLVNGMAARVGGRTVTVQEVRFFMALDRFRSKAGEPLTQEAPGELKAAAQKLLLEEMVLSELRSLRFDGGPRSQAEAAVASRKKPKKAKVWAELLKTYGKSDAEAVDRVWKSLQAEKFISRRIETLTPLPTESETDKYLKQGLEGQGRVLSPEELPQLRSKAVIDLKKELLRKELEEWIVLLKRKYSAVNYLD
jgi:hypothetical protein